MTITVKALQKTGPEEPLRVTAIERRDPRPDDVVIDIRAAGICHSDIHTIRNEWGQANFPLTVGHEIAGVVEAVGSDVTAWKVGDRVGVGCLVNSCGECEECAGITTYQPLARWGAGEKRNGPAKQKLSFGSVIGGAKALAGSNIGGIAETQEMPDFRVVIDTASFDDVDAV